MIFNIFSSFKSNCELFNIIVPRYQTFGPWADVAGKLFQCDLQYYS